MGNSTGAYRQSEVLDVELLDVFAEIEALLRHGREVQREALKVRGLPLPVSSAQRQAAGKAICQHLHVMTGECRALGESLHQLHATATELDKILQEETGQH